ncbi:MULTISPECIES: type II toxin-antitoxin system YafO family toxin [Klebsiella]|uniref:type II toxin-antitoxin system YafO family toxin n=1 Tax=Klebsiella TaxID=570 RepID=UPI000E2D9EFA|nr:MULTISPECIES: type II toxin-antitoxin system YafO family toxin [Klebsiella]EKL0982759.1 type II toxin-antitoxin system YafO family toxin [Klebsiella aerogenes]HAH7695477.1 hypothetical protein [Escherichia coli]HCB1141084.1 type II toxin-antitoxin system YafO family toxin [Klebsiella variicola subsp. variicola]HDE1021812.1 type II toxin-antitoxin system YafO family toxin [Klebsiella quasipneumoniae]EIW9313087.1 hypothetical protein [Klebsiella pneumoniae]
MPLAIDVKCCEKLASDGEFLPFYQEFEEYKRKSDDTEQPRPSNKMQQSYASISGLFGRDRANVDEARPFYQRQEGLGHLHVRQEDSVWEDESGDPLIQWKCTSNSYIIYSYFVHNLVRYYFVVDFIDDEAHANWDNQEAIQMWIADAKAYRLTVKEIAA